MRHQHLSTESVVMARQVLVVVVLLQGSRLADRQLQCPLDLPEVLVEGVVLKVPGKVRWCGSDVKQKCYTL